MHVHEDSSWAVFTEKVKIHALVRESWSENFPRYVSMLIPGRNVLLEMTQAITCHHKIVGYCYYESETEQQKT